MSTNVNQADLVSVQGTVTATISGPVTVSGTVGVSGTVTVGGTVAVTGIAAVGAVPTAVANAAVITPRTDRFGRLLSVEIDPGLLTAGWKANSWTSTQTGTTLWQPASGKTIIVTACVISTFGTTAGRVTVWFAASGDATYNEGTDKPIFDGNFVPSTSATPGAIVYGPIVADAADRYVKVTTDANISVRVQVHGYEVTL